MKNSALGTKYSLIVDPLELYRLPENDLVASIFNIQDTMIDVWARNTSNIAEYSTGLNGEEDFKVYIDNIYKGEFQCYFGGGVGGSDSFPTFENLLPNTSYNLRIEVEYDNEPINTLYEPNLEFTTLKEFEFTTERGPMSSELDVNTTNITSNGFDFTWRTDLRSLYSCDIFVTTYNFVLEIDGIVN